MSLLFSDAVAAISGESGQAGGGAFGSILILVVFVLIFYFLLWRPQSKRAKEHRELVSNLAVSDEIVTTGGIVGTITRITDDFISVKISEEVEIKIQKSAVGRILPKGTIKSL